MRTKQHDWGDVEVLHIENQKIHSMEAYLLSQLTIPSKSDNNACCYLTRQTQIL